MAEKKMEEDRGTLLDQLQVEDVQRILPLLSNLHHWNLRLGGALGVALLSLIKNAPYDGENVDAFDRRFRLELQTHPRRGVWVEATDN